MMALSCEEQEKFGYEESDKAFNLRVVPDRNTFDISLGDPEINFSLYSDTRTIQSVQILVEFLKFGAEESTTRVLLKELSGDQLGTSPSINVPIKLSEFAAAAGLTLDELSGGDLFTIHNKVTMSDGRVYPDTLALGDDEFVNLENSFFTAAGSTSFTTTLAFPVLCPFVIADAVGTYTVTNDEAGILWEDGHQVEIVDGPGQNQVTIKDMYGYPQAYDVVVNVNPETAVATVPKQVAWDSDAIGIGLGPGSIQGQGFYFSCTGFMTVTLTLSVSIGDFNGAYAYEITKNP
jgi:hypothetical protein